MLVIHTADAAGIGTTLPLLLLLVRTCVNILYQLSILLLLQISTPGILLLVLDARGAAVGTG